MVRKLIGLKLGTIKYKAFCRLQQKMRCNIIYTGGSLGVIQSMPNINLVFCPIFNYLIVIRPKTKN